MKLQIIGCGVLVGLLLGCEVSEVQKDSLKIGEVPKEVLENTQDTVAIMEDSNGISMDVVYLGEGVFAFFHPETKEFQSGSVDTSKVVSFNHEDQKELDNYMFKMIKDLYGEDSIQFQSWKERNTK